MRTIVIGDIHGHDRLFTRLLEVMEPQPEDEVLLLGDLIDRGPGAPAVLDTAIALAERTTVTCLRGNHEQYLLGARDEPKCRSWFAYGGMATIRAYAPDVADACEPLLEDDSATAHRTAFPIEPFLHAVPQAHWDFFDATELWTRRGEFFLAHAGADPTKASPEESRMGVLLMGHPAFPRDYAGDPVVFGHTSTLKLRGDERVMPFVSANGCAIGIDTHAYDTGVLTAMVLETRTFTCVSAVETQVHAFDACRVAP